MPTRLARRTTRRQRARAIAAIALAAACELAAPAAAQLTEPFPAVFDLKSLEPAAGGDGSLGFVIKSADPSESFGRAAASAGDINGDGIDDLLVTAPGYTYCHRYCYCYCYVVSEGGAYIIYGRDAASGGFPATIEATDADVRLSGGPDRTHESGYAVAPLGDINGDGVDDVVIGGGEDRSYVIYGGKAPLPPVIELQDLPAGAGFEIRAAGRAASAGDVNGDGLTDIILGGPRATASGRARAGQTYVFFGRDGGFPALVEWTELDGTNGFTLLGAAAGDASGYAAASVGDINGDGVHDIITGAPDAEVGALTRAGTSYVMYGRASGVFPAATDLASLDVSDGFRLEGAAEFDRAGRSVSPAGDINGDGVDDIIVGAPGHSYYDEYYCYCWKVRDGQAYVIFGRGGGGGDFPRRS